MITALLTALPFVLMLVISDARRLGRIRLMERAERTRIRLSVLRHELIMFAGSGKMQRDDVDAFRVLYRAHTQLLKYPSLYPAISAAWVSSMLNDDDEPPVDFPKITQRTRPFVREFVKAAERLINEFANPLLVWLAARDGLTLPQMIHEMQQRKRHIEHEKKSIERLKDAGKRGLASSSSFAPQHCL